MTRQDRIKKQLRSLAVLRLHVKLSGGKARFDSRVLRKRLGRNYKALMVAGGFYKAKEYCTAKCEATTYALTENVQHSDQGELWLVDCIEGMTVEQQRKWVVWEFCGWDDVEGFMPEYRKFREEHMGKTGRIKLVKNRMYSKIQNIAKSLRPKGLMEMDQTATFAASLTRFAEGEEKNKLIGLLEAGRLYEALGNKAGVKRKEAKNTFNTALNRLTSWFEGNKVMEEFTVMFPRLTYKFREELRKKGSRGDQGLFNTLFSRDEGFVWLQALKELERRKVGCVTIHDCVLFEPKDKEVVEHVVRQTARKQWGFNPHMKITAV